MLRADVGCTAHSLTTTAHHCSTLLPPLYPTILIFLQSTTASRRLLSCNLSPHPPWSPHSIFVLPSRPHTSLRSCLILFPFRYHFNLSPWPLSAGLKILKIELSHLYFFYILIFLCIESSKFLFN